MVESPTDDQIKNAIDISTYNKDQNSLLFDDFKKTNPLVRTALVESFQKQELLDEYTIFTTLQLPKYILLPENDGSINETYLQNVSKDCESNCTLISIKDCGHYPSVDQPKEFNTIINTIAKQIF